ncbi:MAG: UDP-N-acetylmuramate dehydrogenase [Chloroflexi bacterium]|nr:UDP-N-acetylmuramate dehydrogenase [Chloroflexota bacterium]
MLTMTHTQYDKLFEIVAGHGLTDQATIDEPMSRHTSFRIGGPADILVRPTRISDVLVWIGAARSAAVPTIILGHGTNLLVADAGVRGLVIELKCQQYELRESPDGQNAILTAEAGASLPGVAQTVSRQGWAGLEWAIGIPSAIGSAVVNNAGAHRGEISQVLLATTVLTEAGVVETWPVEKLAYRYRGSILKGSHSRTVVLSAEFGLQRASPAELLERMRRYTEHRRQTQPTEPSVGSIFRNPTGDFAGRLIERANLKGLRSGGARISPLHANWIINTGNASAADIVSLIQTAQQRVRELFGVELVLEIELVGEW